MIRSAVAIRHLLFEDLGLIAPVLTEHGYEITYLDAGIDPITPDALAHADLVVVLGGPIGVYEEDAYPFLAEELAAITTRISVGRPALGICLGAQLISRALGAEVRSTGKKEIGYAPLTLTNEGHSSVLAPLDKTPVLHWHGDEFAIPDGAHRLAETPGFPNQAFSFGQNVLGLQFHIEADHRQLERWLIGHAQEIATARIDPSTIRSDAERFGPTLEGSARRVLTDWLDQLEHQGQL